MVLWPSDPPAIHEGDLALDAWVARMELTHLPDPELLTVEITLFYNAIAVGYWAVPNHKIQSVDPFDLGYVHLLNSPPDHIISCRAWW